MFQIFTDALYASLISVVQNGNHFIMLTDDMFQEFRKGTQRLAHWGPHLGKLKTK